MDVFLDQGKRPEKKKIIGISVDIWYKCFQLIATTMPPGCVFSYITNTFVNIYLSYGFDSGANSVVSITAAKQFKLFFTF